VVVAADDRAVAAADADKEPAMRRANLNSLPGAAALVMTTAILLHAAPAQQTFPTAQEAAAALVDAAEHNDTAALLKLFGPAGKDIVESGDAAEDKASRAEFARLAHEKLQIDPDPGAASAMIVSIGGQEWPFPVPLVQKDGKWSFDSGRGKVEVLARRIGKNEMTAMEICRGYVEAQFSYSEQDYDKDGILEYAQKIVSSPGKQDGLYWEGATIVPKAFAAAAESSAEAGGKLEPYHGYYFRVLKAQGPDAMGGAFSYVVKGEMIGGFALVAWPAEYGVSGIHAYIVNHNGVVYEKDLGPSTASLAKQMSRFNPDKSWKPMENE
jgi:hypothetical protein